jgi:hypothetical protein
MCLAKTLVVLEINNIGHDASVVDVNWDLLGDDWMAAALDLNQRRPVRRPAEVAGLVEIVSPAC